MQGEQDCNKIAYLNCFAVTSGHQKSSDQDFEGQGLPSFETESAEKNCNKIACLSVWRSG